MKKIKLSPFVHKVKGVKNYTLFDLTRQKLFKITSEGNIEELKNQLVKANLAVETDGVIPFKFEVNMDKYQKYITVRELQVRINGNCDADCNDCGKICSCFKGGPEITDQLLANLLDQLKYITVEHVLITGGNPAARFDILEKIKKNIPASKFSILFQGTLRSKEKEQLKQSGIEIAAPVDRRAEIKQENMKADAFTFFYHRKFNPCWGNKIAVGSDGSIRPCLWSENILGNISNSNIRSMIIAGDFDEYWELTKDKIDTCKDCEYRRGCTDCRVLALKETGSISAKHPSCQYNPYF